MATQGESNRNHNEFPLPVIDLESPTIVQDIRQVCSTIGFFYLQNHGVSHELWDKTFAASKAFFSLPLDEKMKLNADKNHRGYTVYLDEILDPENQTMGDTKEGFYLGREVHNSDLPLHGPNQYPSDDVLPGWKNITDEYFHALWNLGNRLLVPLAKALDCDEDFFISRFTDPMVFLRLLHYSEHKSNPTEGVYGAGAHTDFGMLTFLATDNVPGLQIFTPYRLQSLDDQSITIDKSSEPAWQDIPPLPYTFIVNLGDMLELWTNGFFKSTLHRVVNTLGKERYSIPFFFEPNFTCFVEPMEQFRSFALNSSRFSPTTSGQHLLNCYYKTSNIYREVSHNSSEDSTNV